MLRARDGIITDSIKDIISVINDNPAISYITGEADDEEGNARIRYSNEKLILSVNDCLKAHYSLYIHPSGSVYNIRKLDLDKIEKFILNNIRTRYSFICHDLFRVSLALYGNFYVIDNTTWIYTNTEKSKDVAVNKISKGESVYSPGLIHRRYETELKWLLLIMNSKEEYLIYSSIKLFQIYLYLVTWGQKRNNMNPGIIAHYQITPKKTNTLRDAIQMYRNASDILSGSWTNDKAVKEIKKSMKKAIVRNRTYGRIRFYGVCMLDYLHIKPFIDARRRKYEKKY